MIPRGTMRDIVTSHLPHWDDTRVWVIARPLSGFAETFSQYLVEVSPGGGSDQPEPDPGAEAVLFVVDGDADADRRRRRRTCWSPAATPSCPPGSVDAAQHGRARRRLPLDPQALRSRARASRRPRPSSPTSTT